MTVTFTQLHVPLSVNYAQVPELFSVINDIEQTGSGNLLQAEIQIHVVGANADQILIHLKELFDLGAISDYQHKTLIHQVEALKRYYLK
jgi:hypothetical protein